MILCLHIDVVLTITDKSEVTLACQSTGRGVSWIYDLTQLSEKIFFFYSDTVNYQLWFLTRVNEAVYLSLSHPSKAPETCAFIRLHILTQAFISKPFKDSEKSMLPCQRGLEESQRQERQHLTNTFYSACMYSKY